ncbi:MAG: DUF4386 domain-containing protein [Spirochaetia bacterium]|nr:DUF4386 domain-containing protein [Spirochaetia bacterium]
MNIERKTSIITGVFFIIATAAYSSGVMLLDPITGSPDFLTRASENEIPLIMGALLVLIDSVAVAAIGIILYPIFKNQNEALGLGYAGARIIESALFILNVIFILTLLNLSREFSKAGIQDTSYYQALGTVLLAAGHWAYLMGLGLAFAISALILNYLLYRSKLVPRWISALGFIGGVLVFVNFFLELFGYEPVEILFLPIAVQEMIFAVWLIVKGFNFSAIAGGDG